MYFFFIFWKYWYESDLGDSVVVEELRGCLCSLLEFLGWYLEINHNSFFIHPYFLGILDYIRISYDDL
jgi:hypothetical protein